MDDYVVGCLNLFLLYIFSLPLPLNISIFHMSQNFKFFLPHSLCILPPSPPYQFLSQSFFLHLPLCPPPTTHTHTHTHFTHDGDYSSHKKWRLIHSVAVDASGSRVFASWQCPLWNLEEGRKKTADTHISSLYKFVVASLHFAKYDFPSFSN